MGDPAGDRNQSPGKDICAYHSRGYGYDGDACQSVAKKLEVEKIKQCFEMIGLKLGVVESRVSGSGAGFCNDHQKLVAHGRWQLDVA